MDFKKLKFGLAPMAGYTDVAFRLLCHEQGADFGITELISAESIIRNNEQGFRIAQVCDEERPIGIQLFGSNPKSIANAASQLEKDADFIDLNFGCPAQKVTRALGGAALLARPEIIKEIIHEVSTTIKKPTTAKMRLGTTNSTNAVEIAKLIERSGASALFVHARTLKQGYSGEPDWSKIKEIKDALAIPVFGNGNVRSYADAERMFATTNCDGVLIGRAALGNPFIFHACKKKKDEYVDFKMRKKGFLRYLQLRKQLNMYKMQKHFVSDKNESSFLPMRESLGDLKAQAISFVQDVQGAGSLRLKISQAKEIDEIILCFDR